MNIMYKGYYLTQVADIYGLQRKWWNMEPDFMLRKRILNKIKKKRLNINENY